MSSTNVPLNFTGLNFDCVVEILKYLSIEETFAMIGQFNDVVNEAAKARFKLIKELHVNMRFPPKYSAELLALLGRSIKCLKISVGYSIKSDEVLRILRPVCIAARGHHLSEITLNYIQFDQEYLQCLLLLDSQLTFLDLCNCQLTAKYLSEITRRFKELHTLNITGNVELTPNDVENSKASILTVLH